MGKRMLGGLLLVVCLLGLGGCVFGSVDEMYALPKSSEAYVNLQGKGDRGIHRALKRGEPADHPIGGCGRGRPPGGRGLFPGRGRGHPSAHRDL